MRKGLKLNFLLTFKEQAKEIKKRYTGSWKLGTWQIVLGSAQQKANSVENMRKTKKKRESIARSNVNGKKNKQTQIHWIQQQGSIFKTLLTHCQIAFPEWWSPSVLPVVMNESSILPESDI